MEPPQFSDIISAQKRLAPYVRQTPVSYDSELKLHVKWENRQHTKSFKLRGALNKIFRLPPEQRDAGIVTASSGNHGIGLAYAARQAGLTARIFLPEYTSSFKADQIKQMDATVVRVPGTYQNAEMEAKYAAAQTGATYISSYNDQDIISGHGTIALEWFEQMQEEVTQLLIPLGAGALLSGIALAARCLYQNIRIVGVQAASSPYLYSQFHHGQMEDVVEHPTIMEGLAGALEKGAVTIEMISELCDDVVLVDDEDAKRAVVYVQQEFGEIAEPSGVAGLAALLTDKVSVEGHVTGTVISGGNIEPHLCSS